MTKSAIKSVMDSAIPE